MKGLDGAVSSTDVLKAARAGVKSAAATVASAKQEAKTAKSNRKKAREVERCAKKKLRRAKKELRDAKRTLAIAEARRPRPIVSRRPKPIEPVETAAPVIAPDRTVRAKKKTPRKRAIPALVRNSRRRSAAVTPLLETNSETATDSSVGEPPAVAAEPTPLAQSS